MDWCACGCKLHQINCTVALVDGFGGLRAGCTGLCAGLFAFMWEGATYAVPGSCICVEVSEVDVVSFGAMLMLNGGYCVRDVLFCAIEIV